MAPLLKLHRWVKLAVLLLAVSVFLRGIHLPGSRPAFLRAAEWPDRAGLSSDDTLPLISDASFDAGVAFRNGRLNFTGVSGSGSFIADFGRLDVPVLGNVRARAGLRYSPLYPRGALELGFRKELRAKEDGYDLFAGLQTVGDDQRLDVLTEVGALKLFRGARAFYRFLWGFGGPFQNGPGIGWHEMGSSLGVVQTQMPPGGRGQLTVGWRTGLFDRGLEGGSVQPTAAGRAKGKDKKGLQRNLLDSTPFVSYGLALGEGNVSADATWTLLHEHGVLEHALRISGSQDERGGQATLSAVVEQPLGELRQARLRLGVSYLRD